MNKNLLNPHKNIIFVLGMHRSGTSLVTKAIQAIGAKLGNNLMPAEHSNPKGYWEDLDVFHFNERLLDFIDIRWDIPSTLITIDFNDTKFNTWREEAITLLNIKIDHCNLLAIKDPRISLLIPFWESVATSINVSTQYVIAIRNPLDISKSLVKRDKFNEKKGLVLWLNYNYRILHDLCTHKSSAIFIDYQQILNDPFRQLSRLSYFITGSKITKSSTTLQIEEFINNYIDKKLSHSVSTTDDLENIDQSLQGLTVLYQCLLGFTQGRWSKDKAWKTLKEIHEYQLEAQNYQLQLGYFKNELKSKLNNQRHILTLEHKSLLERNIQDKDKYYKQIILKNDADFQNTLQEAIAKKAHEHQILIDENDIKLNQKDRLIHEINEKLKNIKIEKQNENQNHINSIHKIQQQHEQELESWKNHVNEIHTSYSWKVTTPLRTGLCIIQSAKKKLMSESGAISVKYTSGLVKNSSKLWKTIDNTPTFNIDTSKLNTSKGWYNIQFKAGALDNNPSLYPELLIDYRSGYTDSDKTVFYQNNSCYHAKVFFHQKPIGIRIIPCRQAGLIFRLNKIKLKRMPLPLFIISAAINIYKRDTKNGRSFWDIIQEKLKLIYDFGLIYTINNLNTLISNNEDGLDWGVDYTKWISDVETRYHRNIKTKLAKLQQNENKNNHCVFIISSSLTDISIDVSLDSIKNQLLAPSEVIILHKTNKVYCHSTTDQNISKKVAFNSWKNTTHSNIITLLKSGDQLSEYYLLALEDSLYESPDYDVIYSDNDERSPDGKRCNPHFKPDWSPDFLIESNYIGETFSIPLHHLKKFLYRYKHPIEFLPLYILYHFSLDNNYNKKHINQILFHCKYSNEQPTPHNDNIAVLKTILAKNNNASISVKNDKKQYKVKHPLTRPLPTVSIIIPTKDKINLLMVCIESLLTITDYENYEIIIVDNQSLKPETHSYLNKLSKNPLIRVISYNKEFNYSAINNYAVSKTHSDIVCFLNNDIEITHSEWLSELVSQAIRPTVGCVGAKLYYPDGRVQHGGVIMGIGGVAAHAFHGEEGNSTGYLNRLCSVQNYSAVTAACLAMRRELFISIGEFNQKQLPVAFNDIDLCLRLREQGYLVIWTPYAELIHHESATRTDDIKRSNQIKTEVQYMQIRWRKWIINDPAYNHHLSLTIGNDFEYSLRQKNLSSIDARTSIDINPAQYPYLIENNEDRIAAIVTEEVKFLPEQKAKQPGLSIIILTLEKPELIEPLLKGLIIAKNELYIRKKINIEIIIGDTGSTSPEINSIYKTLNSDITIVRDLTYHFSQCNNQLFSEYVNFDSVLFLNNDIIFEDTINALYRMYVALNNDQNTGIVGSFLTYPDGRLQHGGVSIIDEGDSKGLCYHPGHGAVFKKPAIDSVIPISAVTGACLLIRSDLFVSCGMFDIQYETEAQDIDLCFQARRLGYQSLLCYPGEVQHLENATRPKGEENNQDRARFVRKWAVFYSEMMS